MTLKFIEAEVLLVVEVETKFAEDFSGSITECALRQ